MRRQRLFISLVIALFVLGGYPHASEIFRAITGPFGWLGSIWQGKSGTPMHDQVPGADPPSHLYTAAALVEAASLIALAIGTALRQGHLARRIAMAGTGVATYLAIVATPLPYWAARLAISACAFACIFSARLIRKFKPIKTILFFIGVGFTVQALVWSLANPFANITGFAMFSVCAAFFTHTDKKRAKKTRVLSAFGFLIFVIALTQHLSIATAVTTLLYIAAAVLIIRSLRMYGNNNSPVVSTFNSSPHGLTELNYPHIELLRRHGSRIVYHAPELIRAKDPKSGLIMYKVASIFRATNSVLIGCGTPNVAISVYDNNDSTWKRMSAFMLFREKSFVASLDELQVGVYFELLDVSDDIRKRLLIAMNNHADKRGPSCAHLNASVLAEAGFTLGGGRDITKVILPSRLASRLWRLGLEHDGKPVNIRVVNTSALEVGDHFVGVWRKEANSILRLIKKALIRKKKTASTTFAVDTQATNERDHVWSGRPVTVWVSRPNTLGNILALIWGRHAEYRVNVHNVELTPELSEPLEAFVGPLNWVSKLKKHILFSRPVIAFINGVKNKSFDCYQDIPIDAAIEMMSPLGSESTNRILWNFAVVATDNTYEFRLSPLKNQDPLSEQSKMRKLSNWILAKHVVATGYNERTVYAGEAWVLHNRETGELSLGINNNSGTYKPTAIQLQTVSALIASMGIRVNPVATN